MPKIRKVKELKPKIKEIEKHEVQSDLVEEMQEAEQDFKEEAVSSAGFKISPVLESDIQESPQTIQRENRQRQEIDTINRAYEARQESQPRSTYSSSDYVPAQQTPDVFRDRQRIAPQSMAQPIAGSDIQQNQKIQRYVYQK